MKKVRKIILKNVEKRLRRQDRVRAVVSGTSECPRLSVSRSLRGVFAQLIDDAAGKTLVSAGHKKDADKGDAGERKGKVAVGYKVGFNLAAKAKEKGIKKAIFDRRGNKYHGRIKAVAEGARDGGLIF